MLVSKHFFLSCMDIQTVPFFHCLGDEGHWMWAHSHELLTDFSWGSNHPNTSAANQFDCATVHVYAINDVHWHDVTCWSGIALGGTTSDGLPIAPICQLDVSAAATNSTIL
jgi:hypothetical protein